MPTTARSLTVIAVGAVLLCGSVVPGAVDAAAEKQLAVLVTGATSGIGRSIAETLAANGYFVYAGARKQADMDALNAMDNMQAVRLDVTKPAEIEAAVETVRSGGRGLYGLINNAGVLITGPMTEVDVDGVEWMFDVNVFGVYRVTQAFAPLLVESRGRITNIGSIAGNIGIEWLGAYSMTKHAIEAYTDALASEMARVGVHVSVVAPGTFSSNIWKNDIARARARAVVSDDSPYAEAYHDWIERVAAIEFPAPDAVAETILGILDSDEPERRYLVVPSAGEMSWVTGSAIRRVAELNGDHPFSYTDAELLELLRQALAGDNGATN